ncbi:P-loop containing nucleoside triphosphate hydrolase [Phytophthora cactorum]|nr:P-loop containing nucleoside triphosphate hydrolase [Phytophthora cactorum]
MAGQWTLLRRSVLLLERGTSASAGLTLGLRHFSAPSAPKPRSRGHFKGKRQPQEPVAAKTEPTQHNNNNNNKQRQKRRRSKKAVEKEPPVFTNKFQNLLSFAFEDVANEQPTTETKETVERSPLDLLDGIGAAAKEDDSPELTLAQLGLDGFDDDDTFTKRQPKHPRQKPKKTKLFTGNNDPSTVLAALGIPAVVESDRVDAPPSSRKAMKMNTKRKKGTRNLLKNFQFENSIFDSGADLFGDIDWEDRSDTEDRERRRSQRQQRKESKRKPKQELPAQEVEIPTSLTVKELAERMSVKTRVVFRSLKDLGENGLNEESVLTNDIAELVVDSQNMIPVLLPPDFVNLEVTTPPADCSEFPVRPPIVSVMGHVDHGKTTLLDALRKSKVAATEAGGITQRIGAFSVDMGKKFGSQAKVTFIDTPGHAAFSNMRSRGSELTDLLVLVVAADDGVRPQTSMGGETPMVCVSGKTGEGLDQLKETIALHAEMLDLRGDTKAAGEAIVLEANVARGVGTQVDTIVKWGTLKQGSFVVCGLEYGKVRALVDQAGKRVKQMAPGHPVRVIGLKGLPEGGVALLSVPTEERAKEVVAARQAMLDWDQMAKAEDEEAENQDDDSGAPRRRRRFAGARRKWEQVELRRREAVEEAKRVAALKPGDEGYIANVVPIIVKTDSVGVIAAIDDLIASLPTDEAVIKCIMSAVGPVTSSDLVMAEATGATIYTFNIKHPASIDQEALQKQVTLRQHRIVYSLLDDIKELLQDNLKGVVVHEVIGSAEVIQSIPISTSGTQCDMASMRHFQQKVSEVNKGQECGLQLAGTDEFQPGDILEAYTTKVKPIQEPPTAIHAVLDSSHLQFPSSSINSSDTTELPGQYGRSGQTKRGGSPSSGKSQLLDDAADSVVQELVAEKASLGGHAAGDLSAGALHPAHHGTQGAFGRRSSSCRLEQHSFGKVLLADAERISRSEPTLNGLMAYLGLRAAAELHNTTAVSTDDQQACAFSVGYGGLVSTDTSSAFSVLDSCRNYVTPYKLAIAPDNDFTRKYFFEAAKNWYPRVVVDATVGVTLPSLEDSVVFFDSDKALESYIGKVGYGKSFETPIIYAALVFDEYPEDEDIGTYQSIDSVPAHHEQTYYTSYASQGFMTLQTLVARFVNCMPEWDAKTKSSTGVCTQKLSTAVKSTENDARLFHAVDGDVLLNAGLPAAFGSTGTAWQSVLSTAAKEQLLVPLRQAPQPYFATTVAPFPIESFLSAPFYDQVSSVFPLVFVLAYLYAVSRVLVVLIQEKETRSREYLKILGMSESAIIVSWYITYLIIFVLSAILQAIASSAGLFPNSDPVLIFIFFLLFSLSVLSFGFFMSTLFSRSRTGSFAGMVLFFFMYFVSSGFSSTSSINSKTGACLLPPVALAFGVQTLATAESTGVGMSFASSSTIVNNFKFGSAIGMLFFDVFLYTLAGLYFERVIPREYGTVEKWYFPLQPSYWMHAVRSRSKVNDVANNVVNGSYAVLDIQNPNMEDASEDLRLQERSGEALVIRDIKKEFAVPGGVKYAVRGVSLAMYKDQITCLLGHNGAGKTTLISMLTGMIAPSSGDASFRGLSLMNDMGEIRQSLGLCFQHDVLYSELTVEEHLLFYGRVKGYRGAALREEVNTKITEVGLTEKRRVFAGSLSGGMKRKLSVAICLLGDSSLVFLDEPTSGMDPYSRRSTWEILLNNRANRVMVLTTHFMDEADILGDRIAIMAEGQLRCCGSSLFLKNRYGAGYNFTLVKSSDPAAPCKEAQLQSLITARVSAAKVLSNVGAEIAFQLPLDSTASFPQLFEELDEKMRDLGVLSYGISVTTLEEVFIKVAEASDEDNQHTLNKNGANANAAFATWCALLPVTLLAAGFIILKTSALTRSDVKLALSTEDFEAKVPSVPYFCEADDSQWCSKIMDSLFTGGESSPFTTTDISTPPYTKWPTSVFNVSYAEADLTSSSNPHSNEYCLRISDKIYQRAFGKTDDEMTKVTQTPVKGQYGGYLVHASGTEQVFGYHLFVNTTAAHGAVIFKALMDQALYRFMAGGDTDVTLKANTYPLPMTAATQALFGSFLAFTACIFIVIAFAFFPASIVGFLVKEKQTEHNSKHQQLVSGVSLPAFWLANYLWDLFTYIVPFIAAIVLIQIFDIAAFTGNDCVSCTSETFSAIVLLFILFGLAICPFTYCLSYFFKEHASAQTYIIMINFLLGVVLMVVSFILDVVSESSSDANKVLKFFWRLSPLFNLGSALLNQCLSEIGAAFGRTSGTISPFKMDVMGWELLYLALDSIVFFTVAVGIDFLLSFPKIKAAIFKDPVLNDTPYEEDEDVAREAERVRSGGADGDAVKLLGIRKIYKGNKVAVRNLSFGLPKGECFGYLGINGAGKTTTMKMMTGDILPTSGSGTLGGFDILSEQLEVRRLIGYCPQFDALFELMTVREHLELFARIKGVARADLNDVVKSLMHQMNLDDFENKLAGTLSGGNKRKLSVAIALIGSPPIIFLDEPSTGMDPVSRRFMWNVIAAISTQRKESTIILTTHSMEECEALCTRVGIMVGGRLRCLGSVQHLKHRFGDGLMLELKLVGTPTQDISARVASVFSGSAPTTTFPREELRAKCEALGDASWADKIVMSHATGYALAAALERDGTLRLGMLCAWWAAEERFLSLDTFLRESFAVNANTGVKLLERQNDLCRYKLTGQVPRLANVFRCVEGSKQQLGIASTPSRRPHLSRFQQLCGPTERGEGRGTWYRRLDTCKQKNLYASIDFSLPAYNGQKGMTDARSK